MLRWFGLVLCAMLNACQGIPWITATHPAQSLGTIAQGGGGEEIALYALGLLDTGYTFGGQNPEAGFDCSGMVRFVFEHAIGRRLQGNAAELAQQGQAIDIHALRAGDLVFFNTLGRPFSHVGIYLGEGRFVHAPKTHGRVRIDRMNNPYFSKRFEAARTYFNTGNTTPN